MNNNNIKRGVVLEYEIYNTQVLPLIIEVTPGNITNLKNFLILP